MNDRRRTVTKDALIKRINRVLVKDDQVLKTTRGDRWRDSLGGHFVVDLSRDVYIHTDVALEPFARELGVLKRFERLAE